MKMHPLVSPGDFFSPGTVSNDKVISASRQQLVAAEKQT